MKKGTILLLLLMFSVPMFAQLYSGPAQGFVDSGKVISTNTLAKVPRFEDPLKYHNKVSYGLVDIFVENGLKRNPMSIYAEDTHYGTKALDTSITKLIQSFQGMVQTNSIPPDPYLAVGPNHIVTTVNSNFSIWDKRGTLITTIAADSWYSNVLPGVGSFDPKVIYDHFANRWVMVWLDQNNTTLTSYFLVSVSDDSDPNGTWYNYALPSNVNGTTPNGSWSDYQGVGYDDKAIYITGNNFVFNSSFQYSKVRIIPKTALYSNTAGRVTYNDIWDIRYPSNPGSRVFSIRPAIMHEASNDYYMMHSPSGSSNFMVLFKITNPTTTPSMTSVTVPTTAWSTAPNANQLGGSTILLEGGGSSLRSEIKYRNGFVWAVHSIANPQNSTYSSIHMVKINTSTNTIADENIFGSLGFWYTYPAIATDKDENVAITYSRSGDTEYAGAYYTTKLKSQTNFTTSYTLQTGKANYVKDFSSGRNRWGDYMGIWTDPVNDYNMWLKTEYVSAQNTWSTWMGNILITTYPGQNLTAITPSLNFGNVEKNTASDTLTAVVTSFGRVDTRIDSIKFKNSVFRVLSSVSFPRLMKSYDTLSVKVQFRPTVRGTLTDTLFFYSNNALFKGIPVTAKGYEINQTVSKTLYAVSLDGNLTTINKTTARATPVGPLGLSNLISAAVNPKTKVLYGLRSTGTNVEIIRINATLGDAYSFYVLPFADAAAMSFDTSGAMYIARRTGNIYKTNLVSKTLTQVDSVKAYLASIAFHPVTNVLYAAFYKAVGTGRDKIMRVLLGTGDTVGIGNTGFNQLNNDLEFDETGKLFGLKGSSGSPSDLISISLTNGAGTLIGNTATNNIVALAYDLGTLVGIGNTAGETPGSYRLEANYPNPFNPSTVISYSIPVRSNVVIKIYNTVGDEISILENGEKEAGQYRVRWNGKNSAGITVPAGAYFYEMTTGSFKQTRKMLLVK